MKKPPINIGFLDGKSSKFRFSYSRNPNFQLHEFIPKEKRQGELSVAMHYCTALINQRRKIEGVLLNDDDSNKQGDVIIYEGGSKWYAQLTRLTFNEYERRRAHSTRIANEFSGAIPDKIKIDFPLIVSVFPKDKHKIPMDQLKVNLNWRGSLNRFLETVSLIIISRLE